MKRYRTQLPRAALGLMAAAMSAITFGTLVVLPAQQESACSECNAAASAGTPDAARALSGDNGPGRAHAASATPRAG
jgi:positive regulator of sigma E activity